MTAFRLYDARTGEDLGRATDEQTIASYGAGPEGFIDIDEAGAVVRPGSRDHQRRVRTVWVG